MPLPTTSKTRALPRVWARFYFVKASETFTHGGKRYYKSVLPFVAVDSQGSRVFFAPWTLVRTDQLVRDARPGGKSSQKAVIDSGRTHFVGDDCPGGHADCGLPVQQPNSDNNVSGPTA